MLLYCTERHAVSIDEVTMRGAAGQCLDAQRTGTREQIEASGAAKPGRQPVEECFPDPVASGPQTGSRRERQLAAAPLTADDAKLRGACFV